MGEKTDRVIWQVTDTAGVPILGRVQANLMKYISYLEIHAPREHEQSPVSQDSLKSADYVHSLKTTNHSLQRLHSLWTVSRLHPKPTRPPRKSTELQPRPNQAQHTNLSLHKSSITINGKTHPLPTTKEYILHEYADVFKGVGTLPGGPYHTVKRLLQASPAPTQISAIRDAVCL